MLSKGENVLLEILQKSRVKANVLRVFQNPVLEVAPDMFLKQRSSVGCDLKCLKNRHMILQCIIVKRTCCFFTPT